MMKNYEIPEVKVIELSAEDILSSSSGGDDIILPEDEF